MCEYCTALSLDLLLFTIWVLSRTFDDDDPRQSTPLLLICTGCVHTHTKHIFLYVLFSLPFQLLYSYS